MQVVDLNQGTWVQRCFDPDCRGFRTPALPLPLSLWQSAREVMLSLMPPQQQQEQQVPMCVELQQHPCVQASPGSDGRLCLASPLEHNQVDQDIFVNSVVTQEEADYDQLCLLAVEQYEASVRTH